MMRAACLPHNRCPSLQHRGLIACAPVNHLFVLLGIEAWKPVLTALLLPPMPFLVGILVGARLLLPRRGWGWSVIALSVLCLWLGSTTAAGYWLERTLLPEPPALKPDRVDAIRRDARLR